MTACSRPVCLSLLCLLPALSCGRSAPRDPVRPEPVSISFDFGSRAVDILAVVDNSNSPVEHEVFVPGYSALFKALRSPALGGPGCSASKLAKCRLPDLRFGMITSDVGAGPFTLTGCAPGGDHARIWNTAQVAGCTPFKGLWLEHIDGVVNVPSALPDPAEALSDAVTCTAPPVPGGCEFEQPLEAARRALDPALGVNPGFLRSDALLVVSVITDEDDCSAANTDLYNPSPELEAQLGPLASFRCTELGLRCSEPLRREGLKRGCELRDDWLHAIDGYRSFFSRLKGDRVVFFSIAGPAEPIEVMRIGDNYHVKPSCHTMIGRSLPAPRLKALASALGGHGLFNPAGIDSCGSIFAPASKQLARLILTAMASHCLGGPPLTRDLALACAAPDALGPDAVCQSSCLDLVDCTVEDVDRAARRTPIPRCPSALFDPGRTDCGASCPCWRVVPLYDLCAPSSSGSPYALQVLRAGGTLAPSGSHAHGTCSVAPYAWGSPELDAVPQCD